MRFLVAIDGLPAISASVGDDVTEPQSEHDDGDHPQHVYGETDESTQQRNRQDCGYYEVRDRPLTCQRVNTSSFRRSRRCHFFTSLLAIRHKQERATTNRIPPSILKAPSPWHASLSPMKGFFDLAGDLVCNGFDFVERRPRLLPRFTDGAV